MKNVFIPFEISNELKAKGFNEECIGLYYLDVLEIVNDHIVNNNMLPEILVSAPTYQQGIDWFREIHGLMLFVIQMGYSDLRKVYYFEIEDLNQGNRSRFSLYMEESQKEWELYRDCLNAGIKEMIKLI